MWSFDGVVLLGVVSISFFCFGFITGWNYEKRKSKSVLDARVPSKMDKWLDGLEDEQWLMIADRLEKATKKRMDRE